MLKDIFKDFVTTVNGMGVEVVKVTGQEDHVYFETSSKDRLIIIKAKTKKPLEEIPKGKVFGMSDIPLLSGYINLPMFKDNVDIKLTDSAMTFSGNGTTMRYVIMTEAGIPRQLEYNAPDWNVAGIKPTKQKVGELSALSKVLEPSVKFNVEEGVLKVLMGENPTTNGGMMDFADAPTDTVDMNFLNNYNAGTLLLSFGKVSNSDVCVNISNRGVIEVQIDTGLMEYKIIYRGTKS